VDFSKVDMGEANEPPVITELAQADLFTSESPREVDVHVTRERGFGRGFVTPLSR
jgi:hypothetical protein